MEKSVEKFLNFLNVYKDNLQEKLISLNLITNVVKPEIECSVINKSFIDVDFKYNVENQIEKERVTKLLSEVDYLTIVIKEFGALFGDFEMLSRFLSESKLNAKECMNVISYFIGKNIDKVNNAKSNDELEIVCFESMFLLTEEERDFLEKYIKQTTKSKSILEIIEFEELVSPNRIRANELIKRVLYDNADDIIKCLFDFKKSYIDKDYMDTNDLNVIISCLEKLNFDKSVLSKIKIYLEKEVSKSNKKEDVVVIPKRKEFKSNLLTDKEYKTLKKELYSYYDLYNMKKTRELSYEEINRVIYLLLKIGEPLIEVQNFLRLFKLDYKDYMKSNINLINENNPIGLYLELYEKLKFYSERLNIKPNLKYIEECFKELFICGDEDYVFYKNEIENELLKILNTLPQDYDYEISQIDKRIKLELN